MPYEVRIGTILIKQDALLPKDLRIATEPYVEGWSLVTGLDGYGMDREIRKARWTFFCLAAEMKATVFGIDPQNMVRRAVERILDRTRGEMFNSLEVTRVDSVGAERFPLVRCVTLSARSRHIQESFLLSCADHVRKWDVDAKLTRARREERNRLPDENCPPQEAASGEATGHVAILGA
jgi:hypothetical protein